jgi:hypothetical protein
MHPQQRIPPEATELLARIEVAFRGVPRPRITKHVARGFDDEWMLSEKRGKELAELDPEYNWEDVSGEDVEKFTEYFCFADAEGWRFYLPAYMSHYLRNYSNRHYNPVYLAYSSSPDRLELLTPDQRKCVDDFVELCEQD